MPYTPTVQDRSGEILAQGITQGFSSLVQGVEGYYKKKEEKEILDSTITSLMSRATTSPKLGNYLGVDMSNEQAVRAGVKAAGGGDAMVGARILRQSLQQFGEFERQETKQREEQETFGLAASALGQGLNPYEAISKAGKTLTPGGAQAIASMNEQFASAERQRAEAARVPKPEKAFRKMNLDEINDLKGKGYDVEARPVGNGMYEVSKVSPFAPGAVTNINTGDNRMMADAQASLRKTKTDEINPMIASKASVEAMDALINAGVNDKGQVITGAFANLEIGAKSILNATGLTNFEDVAASQQYLANSATLVGQIIKQFGAGTGLSDSDREFATSAAAGNLTFDKKALVKLVGLAKRVYKKRGELYNKDVEQTFGKPTAKEGFDPARSLYVDPSEFDFSTKGKPSPSGAPLPPGWSFNPQ